MINYYSKKKGVNLSASSAGLRVTAGLPHTVTVCTALGPRQGTAAAQCVELCSKGVVVLIGHCKGNRCLANDENDGNEGKNDGELHLVGGLCDRIWWW